MKRFVSSILNRFSPLMPTLKVNKLPVICLLITVGIGSPAYAQYTPPQGESIKGPTVANGSRSQGYCQDDSQIPVAVLAPTSHVGRTSTTSPTLSWFVFTAQPYRIEVTLYTITSEDTPELIYFYEAVETRSGIVRKSLPQLSDVLHIGQRYYWQVAVACNPDSFSYDHSFSAMIDVVEPPQELETKLATAGTSVDKSTIYAEAGYWYDSVREANDMQMGLLLKELAALEPYHNREFLQQIALEFH